MVPVGNTLSANQSFDTFTVAAAVYTVTRAMTMWVWRYLWWCLCACVCMIWHQMQRCIVLLYSIYTHTMQLMNDCSRCRMPCIYQRVLSHTCVKNNHNNLFLVSFVKENERAQHLLLSAWNNTFPNRNRKKQENMTLMFKLLHVTLSNPLMLHPPTRVLNNSYSNI